MDPIMKISLKENTFSIPDYQLRYQIYSPVQIGKQNVPLLLILNENKTFHIPENIEKENPLILSFEFTREELESAGWNWKNYIFQKEPIPQVKAILDLLDSILKNHPVDFERIYLIGDSAGTYLCWELMRRRIGLFAAALLFGGGTDLNFQPNAAAAIRIYHSVNDPIYPINISRQLYLMLMDIYCDVKLNESEMMPEDMKNSCSEEGLSWIFGIRQKIFTSMHLPEKIKIIELDSCGFSAKILPAAGGNLFSLRHKKSNTPLLREPHRPEELFHTPERFGIPVLFPPNRIEDGSFFFEGKICHLPINQPVQNLHLHGLAVNKPWQLEKQGENFAELKFVFDEKVPEYEGFPFAFELIHRYELNEKGLIDTLTIRNTGKYTMPLGVGYHTAFPAKKVMTRIGTKDYEFEIDKLSFLPTGKCLKWQNFDPGTLFDPFGKNVGFHSESGMLGREDGSLFHGAELIYPEGTLRYITDEKFGFWYTWNASGLSDFICLEPVSWMANALNLPIPASRSGVRKLPSGEEISFQNQLEFTVFQ